MEKNGVVPLRLFIVGVYLCFAAICLVHSDATKMNHRYKVGRRFKSSSNNKLRERIHALKKFDLNMPSDLPNTNPYVSSPFSMPPYDALPPFPLTENTPPFCVNPPPSTSQPPSTIPSPSGGYTPLPPPSSSTPTFPTPSPPTNVPTPTQPVLSPPYYEPSPPSFGPSPPSFGPSTPNFGPSPPNFGPSPPSFGPSTPNFGPSPPYNIPSPSGFVPSPRFLPPIVYPPPMVPPPPRRASPTAMWCVAKAAVPDPIIQEAMNYACGSGADCNQIQPSGSCFQPNTLFAHASYAFNSYWQRTKAAGGTCDFGGTAILVTVDPSYTGCHFLYF